MPFTYVIPDLHGRRDLLDDGLARIARHAGPGTIVALGDYVSKGPQTRQVIERLAPGLADDARFDGWRFVALKGNHEVMMVAALRDPSLMDDWLGKGGAAALASYGGDPAAVPPAHLDWLDRLPLLHADAHRVYVHAGVDPELPLAQQREATLLWKRYPKGVPDGLGALHVVHGHDRCPEGPLLYPGRSNLDVAAWKTGRLVIGVFDDATAGGPVDFIVVREAGA